MMVHRKTEWLPHLDLQSDKPLYEQLVESVALAVAAGELKPGDELPSVRALAAGLRINPNTAARALRTMEREGLSRAVRGVGSVVAEDARKHAAGRARIAIDRELDAMVGVAQRLGMELETVIEALRSKWEE